MKFCYGPVPSRRLGRSLGIDILPSKTCNYQCIYCQLGRTTNFTNTQSDFFPKEDIIEEMEDAIKIQENRTDYITFVGSGEPTLYKSLIDLIKAVRKLSNKPISVITNGSLLFENNVRKALMLSDAVLPSLDAGDKSSFLKINRPHPSLSFSRIIKGLIDFRKNFNGKFRIEVMLVKGINDNSSELKKIKDKIDLINPDKIDLNVPIRPPTEKWVKIPDKQILSLLEENFEDYTDLNYPEFGDFDLFSTNFKKELLGIIERHPLRQDQIIKTFSNPRFNEIDILENLKSLESKKVIERWSYNNKIFWKLA